MFDDIMGDVTVGPGTKSEYGHILNRIYLRKQIYEIHYSKWKSVHWADFYNELFHAWWDVYYEENHEEETKKLYAKHYSKYKRAVWDVSDHKLAQEEAYSETASAIIMNGGRSLEYKQDSTVGEVGHSLDQPKVYRPEAEHIYPDPEEYEKILKWMFGDEEIPEKLPPIK